MRFFCLLALACAACHGNDPEWSKTGDYHPGEPTIAGEPLAIPRFATPPVLDGKLDDALWTNAALIGPFVDTGDGSPVASKHAAFAFARAGYDDKSLYLAFVIRDKDPTSPFARDTVDPHIWSKASGIELMLQPGDLGDNRDYYEMQVDVAGALFDTHWEDYNQPITGTGDGKIFGHMDWQSHIERAVFVQKGSFYSVELALPWASLAQGRVDIPPKSGNTWRMNLYSFRDGQRQAAGWSPIRGQGNFHKASRWGRIQFH